MVIDAGRAVPSTHPSSPGSGQAWGRSDVANAAWAGRPQTVAPRVRRPRGGPGRPASGGSRPAAGRPRGGAGTELVEQLQHARAPFRGLVEVDVEVRDALDAQRTPELVPHERHGSLQRRHGLVALGRLADDADPDLGMPQVRGRFDLRDRREPDPRIRDIPGHDRPDLLPQQLVNAICSLAHIPVTAVTQRRRGSSIVAIRPTLPVRPFGT